MLHTTIPFIDMREKTPVDLLRSFPDKAVRLVTIAQNTYGLASRIAAPLLLPLSDAASLKWLKRTNNPYRYEIETMASVLGIRGVFTLSLSYEWGCTSGVYRDEDAVTMLRILDWPFPELGAHLVVAHQKGMAGEFYNVTWPGVSGVYQAMAPARFSAAINMAPMRRHNRTFIGDWYRNRRLMLAENGLPPSHLLRQVCERAPDYQTAKEMLSKSPISSPVIYILSGTQPGEGCVIERLEQAAEIFELGGETVVSTANHFRSDFANFGHGWRPREIDSAGRYRQSCAIMGHELRQNDFSGLHAPIINRYTRLGMLADAQSHRMLVQGYEGMTPVTNLFTLANSEPRSE